MEQAVQGPVYIMYSAKAGDKVRTTVHLDCTGLAIPDGVYEVRHVGKDRITITKPGDKNGTWWLMKQGNLFPAKTETYLLRLACDRQKAKQKLERLQIALDDARQQGVDELLILRTTSGIKRLEKTISGLSEQLSQLEVGMKTGIRWF